MTYEVAVPTYNRPDLIQKATLAWLDRSVFPPERVTIWISGESQVPLYQSALPPKWWARTRVGVKGLMANRRFAELNHYPEGTRLLWVNDDMFTVRRLAPGGKSLVEVTVQDVADRGFAECEARGAHLWGIYAVNNHFYMDERVHTDLRYVVGCFYGVILRKEPYLQPEFGDAKEDYERAMRFYSLDGRIVRMDAYAPKTIYYNSPEIFPNVETVERNIRELERLWPQWVTRDHSKKGKYPEIRIKDPAARRLKK